LITNSLEICDQCRLTPNSAAVNGETPKEPEG
jgi:hypothetical protein